MRKTFTLLLVIFWAANCYAQKTRLQLNLQKDSTYYLTSKVSADITENIQGHRMVVTTIVNTKMGHLVTAITDSTYELSAQYENAYILLTMDIDGQHKILANTDNTDDLMRKAFKNIVHRPITIVISKTGKVLDIKNIDNMVGHMFDDLPQVSDEKKVQFKVQMEQTLGGQHLKDNFQDAFAVLSTTPVAINDSWVSVTSVKMVAEATTKTTYTLKGITDNAYIIHGDAVIATTGKPDFAMINGFPMRLKSGTGTSVADIKLDKKSCWITESRITKSAKGEAEVQDNPKVPGGMIIPISLDGDISISNK